ncbi:HtaA domain-containing protein [Streptomyces radicis]|uniref:Htaa domain protein n=1 Tax=Streptomyces radicis TaxID=1750517 RepID=A0A3A9X119_9ACTN|nr:HtaA domain-containing protein [Streptomyces radicis]RKN12147.1 Htaa domain protein [Streptomyces radicis]RKN25800.1 Htaa domain protein [Streptomyces radicis]
MLPAPPRRRALTGILTALAVLLPPAAAQAAPAVHPAQERTIAGGRLDWGIRASFQTYVTGPIANGGWTLNGGAATVGESQFRFHSASGGYDQDTGAFTAAYAGGVHFTGHREEDGTPQLDLTISNPTVRVEGGSGTLHADTRSRDRDTGAFTESAQVPLADLDFGGVELRGGTRLAVTGIPATLTAEGATAFAGYYAAGDALDPVTLTADTEEPAAPAPDGPGPSDEPDGEPDDAGRDAGGEREIVDAAVDWGVRRTYREYVTGPVAEGAWELEGGALDGGALFRFPEGEGTVDPGAGAAEVAFAGGVRFTGTGLDLRLDGVTVTVADGTGTLAADVTAEGATEEDQPLVTFEAGPGEPESGLLLLSEVPTELTERGAAAFGDLYAPGTAMDPLTLAIAVDENAELPALPDLGVEPTAEASPEPSDHPEPTPATADSGDGGGASTTTLIATGAAALAALAVAALLLRRRAARAAGPTATTEEETPSTSPSNEESDPS